MNKQGMKSLAEAYTQCETEFKDYREKIANKIKRDPESFHIFGYRKVYEFDNGYGASVIWNPASFGYEKGLFEVAVLDLSTGALCYDTEVTNDVVGFLDFKDVVDILAKIESLPKKGD